MNQDGQTLEQQQAQAPWYKQPWLLFTLAPLVATVIYGTTFLVLSITSADGIVKEDYYRVVRGYEVDTSKRDFARENNISATLKLDNLTGDLNLQLVGPQQPKQLFLDIVSPTHQKYDQVITLVSLGIQGLYRASLPAKIKGKRYLLLYPEDQSWRLRLAVEPPYEQREFTLSADSE